MKRRDFLKAIPLLGVPASEAAKVEYAQVTRGRELRFPRDHGAHPEYRVEWWYLTGWLEPGLGFQVTFFRARPEEESANPSRFNPRQVLFAHAALAPSGQRLADHGTRPPSPSPARPASRLHPATRGGRSRRPSLRR